MFNLESPLMRGLTKVFDLMVLNFLVIMCCIPIITIGPAITALFYVTMKMTVNEDAYIVKSFLKSFRQNFKQAIFIWIFVAVVGIATIANYFIMFQVGSEFPVLLAVFIVAIEIFFGIAMLYIFPLLARFENTSVALLKNAVLLSILHFPTTILLAILFLLPLILVVIIPGEVFDLMTLMPVWMLFGISGPTYVSSIFLNKIFKKLEVKDTEEEGIDETEEGNVESERIEDGSFEEVE